ncbi:hypothetical protein HPB48_002302 [Haemaphysalis longicornis]|uniref:Uncharacterized protein n=1 Tax=Haemaphysalis longicornis TaxID=44386 RepID=A0A9J6GWM5_HAELO|nr:hypothetical protein HPB48_002302 [Haemaphysalis longicornis]
MGNPFWMRPDHAKRTVGLALHRHRRADVGRLGLAIGLADHAMASTTTEMDTTTLTEENGSPDMQLGNYEGNTSTEVPGEDLDPTDTAGWTTTGKRNKQATPSTAPAFTIQLGAVKLSFGGIDAKAF